ncbi:hypothetical protein [Bacillus velezensis]|uniref:hypothetical protein n=1 Tax=Bacillus velezensis TaxID=492670 RepID=UPI000A73A956|nr:hypothetical protein [Bacillus velezensis]
MIAFAKYMNKEYKYTSVQKNTVRRCLEDAIGISKGALDKVQKAIEKGDWWTVLEYLGKLGVAISPPVLFTLRCYTSKDCSERKLINNKAAFKGGFFNPN